MECDDLGMNKRLVVLLSLASASFCALLVSACSGSDDTTGDGGSDATTADVSNDTASNDTGSSDTGSNDTGPSPCADAGSGCDQCCVIHYPDAAAMLFANFETCACTTPGDCAQQCKNDLCKGQAPSGQCLTCLRNADAGDCIASGTAACEADPQCKPYAECAMGCPVIGLDAGNGPG